MSNPSLSNHHHNGNHANPIPHDSGESPDAWKQEHAKYMGWRQQEPPFLHSVKWHDPETGIEHLTGIRADDLDSLFVQVRTVTHLVRIAKQKARDTPAQETQESRCGIHSVQMTAARTAKVFLPQRRRIHICSRSRASSRVAEDADCDR